MPYPAIWTRSQRGQLSADYESVAFPGNTFIFLQKRKTQQCSFFRCAYCAKAMKLRARRNAHKLTVPIVRATLEDGFLDNPDNPFHRHFCIDEEGVDTSTHAAKARYIYNKVKLELLDMPMTPRQAWLQMEAEVIANFPDPEIQQEIIRRLPSDKSAKRSFARRSSMGKRNLAGELANLSGIGFEGDEEEGMYYLLDGDGLDEEDLLIAADDGGTIDPADPSMNDPGNIPLELLNPYSQRPSWVCAPGRERLANFFLIYRDCRLHSPPFMVFSDMMGINLLRNCADIVCDGNSNFYPRGFAQLYTFHAVHQSIPEEAHLCAFALLPNTAPSTYVKLFDIISERMLTEYGDHGVQKNWHFDNQYAAISGCRAIFQDDIIEGSEQRTANFAQLWHDHLQGLFFGPHPNLIRFIRIMREELARASIQAERIFKPPPPITAVNLDNIEIMNKMSNVIKGEDPFLMMGYQQTEYSGGIYSMSMQGRLRPITKMDYDYRFEPQSTVPYQQSTHRQTKRRQTQQVDQKVALAKQAKREAHQNHLADQPSTSTVAVADIGPIETGENGEKKNDKGGEERGQDNEIELEVDIEETGEEEEFAKQMTPTTATIAEVANPLKKARGRPKLSEQEKATKKNKSTKN